jgi:hypothetical protein
MAKVVPPGIEADAPCRAPWPAPPSSFVRFHGSAAGKFRRDFYRLLPNYLQSHVHTVHTRPAEGVAVDSWTRG